jgi:hypothetical protein
MKRRKRAECFISHIFSSASVLSRGKYQWRDRPNWVTLLTTGAIAGTACVPLRASQTSPRYA